MTGSLPAPRAVRMAGLAVLLLLGCTSAPPAGTFTGTPRPPASLAPSASPTAPPLPAEVVAGTGSAGFAGDGGPATAAMLDGPSDMAVDAKGDLYLADTKNDRIRRISANGVIATVAGNGTSGFSGDGGPATGAMLANPTDVAFDASGSLYVVDQDNGRIRRVDQGGIISTFAGNGQSASSGDGGLATQAGLAIPSGIAFDRTTGNLFVSEAGSGRVRRISSDGKITTVVGGGTGALGDGGAATAATLKSPGGIEFGADGQLYIADFQDCRIRVLGTDGTISTLTGTGTPGPDLTCLSSGDGGPAAAASIDRPPDLAVGPGGAVYILEHWTGHVRRVASGTIETVPITHAFEQPLALLIAGRELYIGDRDHAVVVRVHLPSA